MRVRKLIELLQSCDPDSKVKIRGWIIDEVDGQEVTQKITQNVAVVQEVTDPKQRVYLYF